VFLHVPPFGGFNKHFFQNSQIPENLERNGMSRKSFTNEPGAKEFNVVQRAAHFALLLVRGQYKQHEQNKAIKAHIRVSPFEP
jgi:hypothetical protein